MRYAYKTVDRREVYYRNAAPTIAVDALSFYSRAERGRVFQMNLFPTYDREQALDASPVEPEYEN